MIAAIQLGLFTFVNLLLLPGCIVFGLAGRDNARRAGYEGSFLGNIAVILIIIGLEVLLWFFCKGLA